jgi:CRP-like cAMP-binding protein
MNLPLEKKRPPAEKLMILQRTAAFKGCGERELNDIARLVDDATVLEGAQLTREGGTGREAFVIVDGWAAVIIDGEPVAALGPGEVVGEMAMLDLQPRSATVIAKTNMRLLVIGPEAFATFAGQPTIARRIATTMAERLRRADAPLVHHQVAGPDAVGFVTGAQSGC